MEQRRYVAVLVVAVVLLGCSVKRSGLGGGAGDAGSGPMDAGVDGRLSDRDAATSPKDSGPEPDAHEGADAGPRCAGDEPVCEGTVLRSCEDGSPEEKDCAAADAYCDTDDGEPTCIARVCTPGARRCSDEGDAVVECDARGSKEVPMACSAGCDPATTECRSVADCPLAGVTDLPAASASSIAFSLCGQGDDAQNQTAPGCGATLGGQDRIFRLVIETATDVWIDLRDDDGRAAIDTVLYLRTRCDDPSSQIACHDDIACSESDFTCSGVQRRQSRIETRLDPGVYYVVADSYDYRDRGTSWGCGSVLLRYRPM